MHLVGSFHHPNINSKFSFSRHLPSIAMEDDPSAARRSKVNLPIKGMENVVATVTGYTGTERFNLIKLISMAGGNYVGRLSKSITHLVCWKYEGMKYELATKFNTVIINHQWVEDCIKEGRRLPEDSYTLQCGKEVGPLVFNSAFITNTVRDLNLWNDQNKNLLTELEQSRHKSKRKIISKGGSRQENSSTRISCSSEPRSPGFQRSRSPGFQREGPPIFLSQEKGKSASPETSRRSRKRRVVKKNVRKEILDLISDSEQESPRQDDFQDHRSNGVVFNNSVQKEEGRLSTMDACDSISCASGQNTTEALNVVEDTDNVNNVLDFNDETLHVNGHSSYHVRDADANGSGKDIEHTTRLPTSTELSCVICWTDFSATRGVLPCGHRFCFSCIQSWADCMTSSRKTSTCPLCKASFIIITKVDNAVFSDQKIYSQTVPHDDSRMDIYILPGAETLSIASNSSGAPVCCHCSCREPEDLLERCEVCQIQHIHVYCLDPTVLPWTCANCKDLRRLYLHRR